MSATVLDTFTHTLRGAVVAMRLNLLVVAQYRVNQVIWAMVSVLQFVVYLSVWGAVAGPTGSTGGYTAAQFAGYFLVLLVIRELFTASTVISPFASRVRDGSLSGHLLRPLHPFAYSAGGSMAFRIQGVLVVSVSVAILFAALDTTMQVRGSAIAAIVLLAPLAMLAKLMSDCLVACAALWLTRIDGIRGIYYLSMLLLGGQFAPLSVLPDWFATIAKILPFYWVLGFPTELAIGRADVADSWIAAAVLGAWTIALLAILRPVWRAGTRAYEAVGS